MCYRSGRGIRILQTRLDIENVDYEIRVCVYNMNNKYICVTTLYRNRIKYVYTNMSSHVGICYLVWNVKNNFTFIKKKRKRTNFTIELCPFLVPIPHIHLRAFLKPHIYDDIRAYIYFHAVHNAYVKHINLVAYAVHIFIFIYIYK